MHDPTPSELRHLERAADLAATALDLGHEPFGSVLVDADDRVLYEDHNRVDDGDRTRHPELAITQWAVRHLDPEQRRATTVYTSGEHCSMCTAAHAWAGLSRIVFIVSTSRLTELLASWGVPDSPLAPLPIRSVAPRLPVEGPVPALADRVEALYAHRFGG